MVVGKDERLDVDLVVVEGCWRSDALKVLGGVPTVVVMVGRCNNAVVWPTVLKTTGVWALVLV